MTVVVRGEKDPMFPDRLEQELETDRVIETQNSHSKFVLKKGKSHADVAKYWLQYLNYILQFKNVCIDVGAVQKPLRDSNQPLHSDGG